MFWIILIIVIIVLIVHNKNKKKKSTSSTTPQTPTPTPAKPAVKSPAKPTGGKLSAAEEAALSGIDHAAFAKAFAHMSGDGDSTPKKTGGNDDADRKWVREHPFTEYICGLYVHGWRPGGNIYEKVASGALPIVRLVLRVDADKIHETLYLKDGTNFESDTAFESFEAKDGYTRLDTAAKRDELYRCLVQRLGELPTIDVKADGLHIITGAAAYDEPVPPPKPTTAADEEPSGIDHDTVARAMARMNGGAEPADPPEPKPDDTERFKAFLAKILIYYHSMWNKEDGSLYTELDSTMPIDHFAIQVRENCLVESVWLIGDNIPLVTETAYSKLCGDGPVYDRMGDPEMQQKLLVLIGKYLTGLGTVEIRGNDFYPIRAKKAAPPPAEQEKPSGGKAAEEFDEADQEARLRAQVQAMLDQQKKDDQK